MQEHLSCTMELSIGAQTQEKLVNADENKIKTEGCKHLAKAQWNKLQNLNLCSKFWMQG